MKIKYALLLVFITKDCHSMDQSKVIDLDTDEETVKKYYHRDLTVNYSTSELFASTDFDGVTPLVSPITSPRTLEEPSKKNCLLECLKKFYCCLWCSCRNRKKLVIQYDTIQ